MHMSPRELGTYIRDIWAASHCAPFTGDTSWCRRYSSCAGCYTVWMCQDISVRWCTACRWYDGAWGTCERKLKDDIDRYKNYNDTCRSWAPAEWYKEPEHRCGSCRFRDDDTRKCRCKEPGAVKESREPDGPTCPTWKSRKKAVI